MKRILATLTALVTLSGLISGCGQPAEEPNTDGTTTAAAITTATTTQTVATTTTTATGGHSSAATTADTTAPTTTTTGITTTTTTTAATKPLSKAKLGGVSLSYYTVVVAEDCLNYTTRAADYIRDEIFSRTGAALQVVSDEQAPTKYEIVVGETNRAVSKKLNADTEGMQFALMAQGTNVALEGDYFIIAAAAYYFITTYITGENVNATVPEKVQVLNPIQREANNYIFLIGDGMGINHTKLPEGYDKKRMTGDGVNNFTDGEDFFYGYLFPYQGSARTHNVSGQVTDSAASATALATGAKTGNGRIGRDKDKNDLLSLTEIAISMGKNTAIMSTEGQTGATPGGFSAHTDSRENTDDIKAQQEALTEAYGTIINCKHDYYDWLGMFMLEYEITDTLKKLSGNENGFFMMYEEAYIDKHSHSQAKDKATWAVFRFNQAIALFMEYAFYHPDTFVLITADHETGGLTDMGGILKYSHGDHTAKTVPVFAYGIGGDVFHGQEIENVQIPKTIAKMWGKELMAETDGVWPPLN
ncbi:MAG: alkaline phosphatase [Clostridia bacterium]|nr:alkaline phosphatase [Clostridia bacterium]